MACDSMKYPRYVDRCSHAERTRKLICPICPEPFNTKYTWRRHLHDPQHLSIAESFHKLFSETESRVICKLCSKSFAKYETVKHAISHEFPPWHKPTNLYLIFVKNFIAQIDNKYYCHLCKEQFLFWHIALAHVNDQKHLLFQKDKICEDIDDELPTNVLLCQSLINNSVFSKNLLTFECMVCDRPFGGYQNFEEHVKGKGHRSNEEKLIDRLRSLAIAEKQEAVIENNKSVGKRKKKFTEKHGGSTGVDPNSANKEKSKGSGRSQKNTSSKKATSEVSSSSSSNAVINCVADEIIKLEATPSEGQSAPNKPAFPHRQLGRVIHKSALEQAKIICRLCKEKVKDNVELHVHLTNHFWPQFIRYTSADDNQSDAFTHDNHLNELGMNDDDEIMHHNNCPDATGIAPLELDKFIKLFTNTEYFPFNNGGTIEEKFDSTHQNHKVIHSHLINPRDEEVIIHHPRTTEPGPPVITSKGTSRLQFFENLSKQLAPDGVHTNDEPIDVFNKPTPVYEFPAELYKNEEFVSRNESRRYSKNIPNRETEVSYSGKNCDYIYEINNKQLENIKLGIILSFTRDEINIYCLICRKNIQMSTHNIYEHLCNDKHNDSLEQMRQDHLRFATFPNTMSDLHLALQFMEETSDLYVKCWACDEAIPNDTDTLNYHIGVDDHRENCRMLAENSAKLLKPIKARMFRDWYNVQHYWCVICSINCTSEYKFVKHLHSHKHHMKCQTFEVFENLMLDFCPTCATLWLGFRSTFTYHCQCKMHKYHLKDHFYYVTALPREAANILTNQSDIRDVILRVTDYDMIFEKPKEEKVVNDLLEAAQEEFFRAKIYPFGSRISGLAAKNADFDVFVDCNDMYYEGNPPKKVMQYLRAIEESLKNRPKTWKIDRTIIENVRTPIIKTHHRPTGIECDISFTNGLTVEKTKLIRNYILMYPMCRNLIIFIKKWMNACDLTGPNGFTSYTIVWMVIYYLQKENILPCVAKLIEMKGKSQLIAGWETGVEENFDVSDAEYSFYKLLHRFFITYSQFNYKCDVICPLLGKPVTKGSFDKSNLPNEMSLYNSYVYSQTNSGEGIEKFRTDAAVCVQDPFDLALNLTKSVKKFFVYRLREFCSISAETLQKNS